MDHISYLFLFYIQVSFLWLFLNLKSHLNLILIFSISSHVQGFFLHVWEHFNEQPIADLYSCFKHCIVLREIYTRRALFQSSSTLASHMINWHPIWDPILQCNSISHQPVLSRLPHTPASTANLCFWIYQHMPGWLCLFRYSKYFNSTWSSRLIRPILSLYSKN